VPVTFSKDGPLGDFDGFDSKTIYQMVPERDRRDLTISTLKDISLEISDPSVATMANFIRFSGPSFSTPSLTTSSISLPAKSRVQFSLIGVSVGHTELLISEADTGVPQSLLISVKRKVARKYALCFLRDIRRATIRPKTEAQGMMDKVRTTYLQQTNVDLQLLPPHTDVVVTKNLGNPLFVGNSGLVRAIIDATPAALFMADVIVYCCWDVEDRRPVKDKADGVTSGKLSFVQDGGDPQFIVPLIFAHEVGHALGLDHTGNKNNLMFPSADRSSKLGQFEIDTVNTSGTVT
jgi:hypothetical protein